MEFKGAWSLPKNEGIGPLPRGGHAAVAMGNRLLIFGGADRTPTTLSDLWVLELVDGSVTWTRIFATVAGGGEVLPRSGASLTAAGTNVYMFGGQDPTTGGTFNDVLVLDTLKWQWADLEVRGGRPPPRHSHCAGLLQHNCLVVFGGAGLQGMLGDVWTFNIGQRTWTRPAVGGYAPPAREMHTGVMVGPARMLVFGGRGADGRILCDAALLDVSSMTWVKQEATPFARCAHAATLAPVSDAAAAADVPASPQHVLVHGGFSGDAVVGDVLLLDAATLAVTLLQHAPASAAEGPAARFAHCAATLQTLDRRQAQAMVVFGGVNPQEDLADVALWLPAAAPPSQTSSADTTTLLHPTAAAAATGSAPAATAGVGPAHTSSAHSASASGGSRPTDAAAGGADAGGCEQTSMLLDATDQALGRTADTGGLGQGQRLAVPVAEHSAVLLH